MDEAQWNHSSFTRTNSSPIINAPAGGKSDALHGKQQLQRASSEMQSQTGYTSAGFYGEHMFSGGKKGGSRGERETVGDQNGGTGRRWSSADEVENHVSNGGFGFSVMR